MKKHLQSGVKLAIIELYLHDLYIHFSAMHDRTIYACVKYTDNTYHVLLNTGLSSLMSSYNLPPAC